LAARYSELAEVCKALEVKPHSGDLMDAAQWANNINYLSPAYLPDDQHGSIILTMRMGEPEPGRGRDVPVAALRVASSGFYCSTLTGGNHDMSAGELRDALNRIKHGTLARIFGAWPGNESEEHVRQALDELS
jgi:hypothetical protein